MNTTTRSLQTSPAPAENGGNLDFVKETFGQEIVAISSFWKLYDSWYDEYRMRGGHVMNRLSSPLPGSDNITLKREIRGGKRFYQTIILKMRHCGSRHLSASYLNLVSFKIRELDCVMFILSRSEERIN